MFPFTVDPIFTNVVSHYRIVENVPSILNLLKWNNVRNEQCGCGHFEHVLTFTTVWPNSSKQILFFIIFSQEKGFDISCKTVS